MCWHNGSHWLFRWWIWDMSLTSSTGLFDAVENVRAGALGDWEHKTVFLWDQRAVATLCRALHPADIDTEHWDQSGPGHELSIMRTPPASLTVSTGPRLARSDVRPMFQVVHCLLLVTLTSARPEPESPSSVLLRSLAWLRLPGLGFLLPARPQPRTLPSLSSLPRFPSLSRPNTREKRVHDNNNRQLCEDKVTANNFLIITPYFIPFSASCVVKHGNIFRPPSKDLLDDRFFVRFPKSWRGPHKLPYTAANTIRGFETFTLEDHIRCVMFDEMELRSVIQLTEPNLTWFIMWTVQKFMRRKLLPLPLWAQKV